MSQRSLSSVALAAAMIAVAPLAVSAKAQELPMEGPVPTSALISVQSRNSTPLDPALLELHLDGRQTPVTSVFSVGKQPVQVAILIDDGLRANFGVQIPDLKKFLAALPGNVQTMAGYMENGRVRGTGEFTTDHNKTAESLRIPLTSPGISASPYFCLQDFVKHWPGEGSAARMVLMITNGVDLYNGSVSPTNQNSPYVDAAQADAQRAGVAVYAIYFSDAGIHGGLANFSGQSYLNQVAEATGGQSFYQGRMTPPSIAPYLAQFRQAIAESYVVTFPASAGHVKDDTLLSLRLKSRQPGMKLHTPMAVHPGQGSRSAE